MYNKKNGNREAEKNMDPKEKMKEYIKKSDVEGMKRLIGQYEVDMFKDDLIFHKIPYLRISGEKRFELIQFLLDKGYDINEKDVHGDNLLYYEISKGRPDVLNMLRFLIEKGININQKSVVGKTALYHAIELRSMEVAEFLYENGADPNIETIWNDNVIQIMKTSMLKKFIPIFLKHPERLHEKNLKYLQRVRLENLYK